MGTLLVVDDEPDFAKFICDAATAVGYDAEAVLSAEEFRRRCLTSYPSVMTVDLNMPELDGLAVLRELAEYRCPAQIILISGVDARLLSSAERLGRELGLSMAGKFRKPVRAAELQALLQTIRQFTREVSVEGLSRAIAEDRLFLVYQPQIVIGSRQMAGVEALVRMRDERGVLIAPDAFIPLAEKVGLIDKVTDKVVDMAFDQALRWRQSHRNIKVAINLSAKSLHDRQLPDRLDAKCRAANLPPSSFTLELTETATSQDFPTLLEILGRFRLKGFHLSIDDFGTGYSSIAQLIKLPFTELKIDKSFVTELDRSDDAVIVTKTVIDMARNLGLTTVAEGVESPAALAVLDDFGCETAQGYLFSRPVDSDLIVKIAADGPETITT